MKNKKTHLISVFVIPLAIFWAYSFSTRIGLFFLVPLWLKIILLLTLTMNFWFIGFYLLNWFIEKGPEKQIKIGVVFGSITVAAVIFLFAPYQRVPFRTTHHLEVTSLETEVQLKVILSPDDNPVERDAFDASSGVKSFFQTGFRIPQGEQIRYRRPFTGKLSLIFTDGSGPARIYWDGTEKVFEPELPNERGRGHLNGWRVIHDPAANEVELRLPGNTWGEPDLFWGVLGILLPISDFITLTSILVLSSAIIYLQINKDQQVGISAAIFRPWIDFLISIFFIMVLIRVGFPNFLPFWFLMIYLPATIYLTYCQINVLIEDHWLKWENFSKMRILIKKVKQIFSQWKTNPWVLWVSLAMIGMIGSVIQLSMTSPGMIISGDSVHYMDGARNLAEGNGYVISFFADGPVPITGFDPGYPIMLVPGILLGLDAQVAARLLNSLLLFITVLLVGLIIYRITHSVFPAIIASLFVIQSTVTVSIFSFVMSEPLFIVLLLLTLLLWFVQFKKPSNLNAFLAGLVCTMMLIVRLAGVVFLPVLAVGLLVFEPVKIKHRIRHTILFGMTSLIAPVLFFLRNRRNMGEGGRTQGRGFVPFPQESWEVIGTEFSNWFNWQAYFNYDHQRFNAVLISFGVILFLFLVWLVFRKQLRAIHLADKFVIIIFFSSLIYFGSIILNSMTAVPVPTAGGIIRYMIPLLFLLIIIVGKLFHVYWNQPVLFSKLVILFITLESLQLYHGELLDLFQRTPIVYRHYTDRKNDCGNEVLEVVGELPDVEFYSNRCEYFYFLTGKQCHPLSFDRETYSPGGRIYQATRSGDVIAFTRGFGSDPPGIRRFLSDLDLINSACYISFFIWTE